MDIARIRFQNLTGLLKRYRTQTDFATAVDTAPAYISQLISASRKKDGKRGVGNDFARKIERQLNLPYGWMDAAHNEPKEQSNVQRLTFAGGKVPVLPWEAAKLNPPSSAMKSETTEWIQTGGNYSAETYALRVEGDAMSPDFPSGTVIIVDPLAQYKPESFVIVQDGESVQFKQLIQDGLDLYLKPCNPQYPIKPLGTGNIVGVVCESIQFRRLI
jgi:SOS-response transcriptional repressor LexA